MEIKGHDEYDGRCFNGEVGNCVWLMLGS